MIQDILHIDVDFADPFLLIGFLFFYRDRAIHEYMHAHIHWNNNIIII